MQSSAQLNVSTSKLNSTYPEVNQNCAIELWMSGWGGLCFISQVRQGHLVWRRGFFIVLWGVWWFPRPDTRKGNDNRQCSTIKRSLNGLARSRVYLKFENGGARKLFTSGEAIGSLCFMLLCLSMFWRDSEIQCGVQNHSQIHHSRRWTCLWRLLEQLCFS